MSTQGGTSLYNCYSKCSSYIPRALRGPVAGSFASSAALLATAGGISYWGNGSINPSSVIPSSAFSAASSFLPDAFTQQSLGASACDVATITAGAGALALGVKGAYNAYSKRRPKRK